MNRQSTRKLPRRNSDRQERKLDSQRLSRFHKPHHLTKNRRSSPSHDLLEPEDDNLERSGDENTAGSERDSEEDNYHSKAHRSTVVPRLRQPLKTTIDWRAHICQFLKLPSETSDEVIAVALEDASEKLEEADRLANEETYPHDLTPKYQVIHTVRCAIDREPRNYLDEPYVMNNPEGAHLRGVEEIDNFELFLERNKAISFLTYRDYRCCDPPQRKKRRIDVSKQPELSSLLVGESVSVVSQVLSSALKALGDKAFSEIPHPDFLDTDKEFYSPYLWWFSSRANIEKEKEKLREDYAEHIAVFEQYLKERLGAEWIEVDVLLSQGKITAKYLDYLYVPNNVLLQDSPHEKYGQQQAYLARDWLSVRRPQGRQDELEGKIECSSWNFDGNFQKLSTTLTIQSLSSATKAFNIKDLSLYPISFANSELVKVLRARGNTFWQCRERNYVCYRGDSFDGIQSNYDPRFMIDIATYRQMHPATTKATSRNDLGPNEMARNEPPQKDEFILCLPRTIAGFDMNKKEWINLDVSRISSVNWNTEAFESLVVDRDTKELISALVTNQIHAERSTDLMSGKGNGLFILLHGSPGTGKTLTAESVAEYSKKPLYRVTCGDIGTKAEDVEKYLEVVMLLGKTWGCVVLLDEADVFLEQRKISDLQRNALVSVFLRVLEYYDGILILTSNRVGFFDEAFKSRIQLTLRYKNLDQNQRIQIWETFVKRLEKLQSTSQEHTRHSDHESVDLGIDISGVREHLLELSKAELNGREIRNAISTARQLAMFRKEQMGYHHLELVIKEARKFEDYLLELRGGFSSDEIMEQQHARLSNYDD